MLVGPSPGLAEDGRKGVFLLAINGSLHSLDPERQLLLQLSR